MLTEELMHRDDICRITFPSYPKGVDKIVQVVKVRISKELEMCGPPDSLSSLVKLQIILDLESLEWQVLRKWRHGSSSEMMDWC